MIGRTLAHYTIVDQIGAGGMGAVYRAQDTKLGRDVALKVLPEEVASDSGFLDRFQREARALAAIDHPNIVTVYSVEEDTGVHFLTMALVTGESLEVRLQEGALALPVFFDVAAQLTDALTAAHDKGVVHRDLKPGNVMVSTEGRVKVLDFGLAKLADADPSESHTELQTQAGTVLGTVPYMSPEQVQGRPLDHRSDIFSLGILLHEMATGQRPFQGDNPATLSSSILRDEPPAVTEIDPGLPGNLAQLILGCMKKDAGERFQTSGEVRDGLARVGRGETAAAAAPVQAPGSPAPPSSKAVVVLPFVNRSPDPDNEYFSDGLTEEVISDLSGIGALRVISRNSAMTLKGTTKDTRTLASELGVSHLVTGSVRRAGDALRVTAELVDAATDAPIWSDKFDGTVEDVFGIQEEISRKIVSALEVRLTDTEERQVGARPIDDPIAYDCYLRARHELYQWTPEAIRRAHELVDEALAIVGDNAVLLATKAHIHNIACETMLEEHGESTARAAEFVRRALVLDPDSPPALFARGIVAGGEGDVEQALADLRRAHELWPGDGNVLTQLCRKANAAGLRNYDHLIDLNKQIDPLGYVASFVLSTFHSVNGRPAQAASAARRAIELAPAPSALHVATSWQIAEAGHTEEAIEVLASTGEALAGTMNASWALLLKAALEGDAEAALAHFTPELERSLRADHFTRTLASAFALVGNRDEALRWTRLGIDVGFINYPFWAEHDPFLGDLRADPEFRQVMAELKPRWEKVVEWEKGLRSS